MDSLRTLSDDMYNWFLEGKQEVLSEGQSNQFLTAKIMTDEARKHSADIEWDFFTTENGEEYEGRILCHEETVGYVGLTSNGKAMVWNPVFPLEENRIVFPSGVPACWSDDDAQEMVERLVLGTQGVKIDTSFYRETSEPETCLPISVTADVPDEPLMATGSVPEIPLSALYAVEHFLSPGQFSIIKTLMQGEEKTFFENKALEIASRILGMPKTSETANDSNPMVYLHYFEGSSDWYIFERDMYAAQQQAMGYVCLNASVDNAECGYVSIEELRTAGIELDLYWTPIPLLDVKNQLRKKYGMTTVPTRSAQTEMIDAVNAFGFDITEIGPGRITFGKDDIQVLMVHDDHIFTVYYGENGTKKASSPLAEDALIDAFGSTGQRFEREASKSSASMQMK